jgi:hypothetical protein
MNHFPFNGLPNKGDRLFAIGGIVSMSPTDGHLASNKWDEIGLHYSVTRMIDLSKVTEYLYVGSRVRKEHADELKVRKFDLIISMIGETRFDDFYLLPPFKTLWIRTYDPFLTPIPVKKLFLCCG